MRERAERLLLQLTVAVAGFVPVIAGGDGFLRGIRAFGLAGDGFADSHIRYLSGLLLGIGLAFWAAIPNIERHGTRFLLLTFVVFIGGCARLLSVMTIGGATQATLFALAMELLVTPLICLWQHRIARIASPWRRDGRGW